MHAQLSVTHKPIESDVVSAKFIGAFGAHSTEALKESTSINADKWSDIVVYCHMTPKYLVVAFPIGSEETQIHIEAVDGPLLGACRSVWSHIISAFSGEKMRFNGLDLVESQVGFLHSNTGLSATTGLKSELTRQEVLIPISVAIAVLVYGIIGALTFASDSPGKFLQGAVAGVVAGAIVLLVALRNARRGKLRWSEG